MKTSNLTGSSRRNVIKIHKAYSKIVFKLQSVKKELSNNISKLNTLANNICKPSIINQNTIEDMENAAQLEYAHAIFNTTLINYELYCNMLTETIEHIIGSFRQAVRFNHGDSFTDNETKEIIHYLGSVLKKIVLTRRQLVNAASKFQNIIAEK